MSRLFSKLRKDDEKCADIVSNFLDKNFYKHLESFERVYDKEKQWAGIDTEFIFNKQKYLCDEKAAIRYVNKNLNTFSMELSFIDKSNNIHDGWLIDKEKKNNSLMPIWIDKADNDMLLNENDIHILEFALIRKEAIMDYLESLGWTYEKLIKKTIKMRNNPQEYGGNAYKNGCKFVISNQLVEKPVNVIIPRKELKKISDYSYMWNI